MKVSLYISCSHKISRCYQHDNKAETIKSSDKPDHHWDALELKQKNNRVNAPCGIGLWIPFVWIAWDHLMYEPGLSWKFQVSAAPDTWLGRTQTSQGYSATMKLSAVSIFMHRCLQKTFKTVLITSFILGPYNEFKKIDKTLQQSKSWNQDNLYYKEATRVPPIRGSLTEDNCF